MDSGKRASMREGPLAALFRRTDEDEGQEPEPRKPERKQKKPATGRPFPAAQTPGVAEHSEELRPAPPSARVEHTERPARTPEQRLREVFAADIPENIMERSAPTRSP